jgi:hypothetical protein
MQNTNNGLFGLGELLAIAGFAGVAIFGLGSMGCSTYEKDVRSPAQEKYESERFGLDTYRVSTFESDGHVSAPELDIEFTSGEGKSLSRDIIIEKPVDPNTLFSCDESEVNGKIVSGCKHVEFSAR